jgi:DNA invertase Pin-like site-specific DNA recombinase
MRTHLPGKSIRRALGTPELHRLIGQLRKGDVVVVWKLDRLSRSLKDVLTLMETIQKSNVGFKSLTEAIDTLTPAEAA